MSTESRAGDRNLEGILHYLNDYLAIREQQTIRINPGVAGVINDMVWVQVTNLRRVMSKTKAFGPERLRVADILASDDEAKRRSLFHHADQNSIIFEIMNKAEDQHRGRVSEMPIHDMRTLFRALNPALEVLVELIQHWILWDLPDAADMYNFDEQMKRCAYVRTHDLSEAVLHQYMIPLHKRPSDTITRAEVIRFELHRLEVILNRFLTRCGEEEPYQMIIRRDELPGSAANRELLLVAKHLMTLEHLESAPSEPLEAQLIEYYAQVLNCPADQVTRKRAIDYENRVVANGKRALRELLDADRNVGEPYNYKHAQAQQRKQMFEAEQSACLAAVQALNGGNPSPSDATATQPDH
ncbi:MAG: hypothetical protein N2111_06535 [Candidatus Sumerlaeaceae bacterium]|nr:hypothetical protein [Candidatus Sumerlaeaceae bacterium]